MGDALVQDLASCVSTRATPYGLRGGRGRRLAFRSAPSFRYAPKRSKSFLEVFID